MNVDASKGIVALVSRHGLDETVERLTAILRANGIKLFALIDHSGEAEQIGIAMPPTRLLIFGNPAAGTPLMLAAPTLAMDLPLKILVHQDGEGRVWVSYNSLEYLQTRHGIPADLLPKIAGVEALAAGAAETSRDPAP